MANTVLGTHGSGIHSARPAGNAVPDGSLYSCTTHSLIYVSSYGGNSWSTWASLTGTGLSDPMTTRGDIIVRDSSNVTARKAVGAANTVLRSDGTDPAYSSVGQLLAQMKYTATNTSLTQSSATLGDADSTNLKVTFTAPASGNVLVTLSGVFRMNASVAAGSRGYWGLRESTTVIDGPTYMYYANGVPSANVLEQRALICRVDGISAGSHTYKWGIAGDGSASAGVYLNDLQAMAVMTVHDAG